MSRVYNFSAGPSMLPEEVLKELGVNIVHLLPTFDYESIDESRLDQHQYNWGYEPLNYNAVEGSFSTDPYDPVVRVREFKQISYYADFSMLAR